MKRTGDIKESAAYLTLMTRYLQTAYKVRIYLISNLLITFLAGMSNPGDYVFGTKFYRDYAFDHNSRYSVFFFLSRTRH